MHAHPKCLTGKKKKLLNGECTCKHTPIHSSTGVNRTKTIPWLWAISTARGINLSPVFHARLKSTEDHAKMVRRKIVCSVWIISASVSGHVFLQVATQNHLLYRWCSKSSFYCCWQASTTMPLLTHFAKSASAEKSWPIIANLTKVSSEDDQAAYRPSEQKHRQKSH